MAAATGEVNGQEPDPEDNALKSRWSRLLSATAPPKAVNDSGAA